MQQPVLVDPEREAAHLVCLGDDHALRAAVGNRQLRLDRVRAAVDARDHARGDVLDVAVERLLRDGRHRRQHAEEDREPGQQRQHVVFLRLLPEQLLQLGELLGVFGCDVVRLAEVVGQVVELPAVLLGVVGAGRESGDRRTARRPRGSGRACRRPTSRPCTWRGSRRSRSTAPCAARRRRVVEGVERSSSPPSASARSRRRPSPRAARLLRGSSGRCRCSA